MSHDVADLGSGGSGGKAWWSCACQDAKRDQDRAALHPSAFAAIGSAISSECNDGRCHCKFRARTSHTVWMPCLAGRQERRRGWIFDESSARGDPALPGRRQAPRAASALCRGDSWASGLSPAFTCVTSTGQPPRVDLSLSLDSHHALHVLHGLGRSVDLSALCCFAPAHFVRVSLRHLRRPSRTHPDRQSCGPFTCNPTSAWPCLPQLVSTPSNSSPH